MSTVKTDLLQNRLGTSHPAVTKATFCKSHANVNQTTSPATLKNGFNVSSVTDVGVGHTRSLFTSLMSGSYTVANGAAAAYFTFSGFYQGADGVSQDCMTSGFVYLDDSFAVTVVFGNLA